jgi:radical SAM protein with 4Fe4S-binding SPASM domain
MCPVNLRTDTPDDGAPAFLPFDRFVSILNQFHGLKELHLQGLGEPMMHPRFFDMVEYATQQGVDVSCNSNFTLVNEARAERCVTSGLEVLNVSLDGATAESYEVIRVGARFDRVVRNIRRLQDARRRLCSETPNVVLTVVVMRRNLRELPGLVRLAYELSIRSIFVQHLGQEFTETSLHPAYHPLRVFVTQESLLTEDVPALEASFADARRAAAELGIALRLPRLEPAADSGGRTGGRRCDWPWNRAYLTYQGYAVPCCMIATPDRMHFGNVMTQGVANVWNGEEAVAFRRRLDSEEPPELCASCSVYKGAF